LESEYNPKIDYEGSSKLTRRQLAVSMVATSDLELISRKKHGDDFQRLVKPLLTSDAEIQEDESGEDESDEDSDGSSLVSFDYESDHGSEYRMNSDCRIHVSRGRLGMGYAFLL
jgi:hypothetical protein